LPASHRPQCQADLNGRLLSTPAKQATPRTFVRCRRDRGCFFSFSSQMQNVLCIFVNITFYYYHFLRHTGSPHTHTHTTAYNHIHQHTQNYIQSYILRSIKSQTCKNPTNVFLFSKRRRDSLQMFIIQRKATNFGLFRLRKAADWVAFKGLQAVQPNRTWQIYGQLFKQQIFLFLSTLFCTAVRASPKTRKVKGQ